MDVSRYQKTAELQFYVVFVTPTFLGGARGNAELRTAPFKTLLRRWWRIVNGNLSSEDLWKKESRLFGSTEKDPDIVEANKKLPKSERKPEIFGKSKVSLSIISSSDNLESNAKIDIGEIGARFGSLDLAKFLGYGAVGFKSYIKPGSQCLLSIKVPNEYKKEIIHSIFLIHLFGTIGSRSRNGWGSISLIPKNFSFNSDVFTPPVAFKEFADWNAIIKANKNYPTAIGKDENGVLCWRTKNALNYTNWEDALNHIGTVYYELLKAIKKENPDYRVLLGTARGNKRQPAQIMLKVIRLHGDNGDKYYGLIIHIPYPIQGTKLPQGDAGKFIHSFLDKNAGLEGWQRK